jgi:hypothetical protein
MIALLSRPLFPKSKLNYVNDSPYLKTFPLIILSIGAVIMGFFSNELFLSNGSTFYLNSLFIHPNSQIYLFDASYGTLSLFALLPVTFLFLFLLILRINSFKSNNKKRVALPSYPSRFLPFKIKESFNLTSHFS